jgi:hypothetical protein
MPRFGRRLLPAAAHVAAPPAKESNNVHTSTEPVGGDTDSPDCVAMNVISPRAVAYLHRRDIIGVE